MPGSPSAGASGLPANISGTATISLNGISLKNNTLSCSCVKSRKQLTVLAGPLLTGK
jgi:hypothetical protein